MLEEVDEEVTGEDEHRRHRGEALGFRHHLQDDGREHEAGTERDRKAEQAVVPVPERHQDPADEIGERGKPDAEEAETEVRLAHSPSGGRAASSAPSPTSCRVPEPSLSSICFAHR